jgi:hypothetical protein
VRALALLGLAALAAAAQRPAHILHWQGRTRDAHDTADLPVPARAAVAAWRDFAIEHDYQMLLDDDGRLLYVTSETKNLGERRAELAQRTAEVFDRALPPPPPVSESSGGDEVRLPLEASAPADEIPEDPEGPPPGWRPPPAVLVVEDYVWGAVELERDTDTMVLIALKNEADFHAALAVLAELQPYLAAWIEEAKKDLGFVLQMPLVAGFVLNAAELEEWNPENELVNRVARLFLLRRFAQQPHWLTLGWAWYVELEVQGAVYCFPHRREFVWATEHTDWDKAVRQQLARARGKLKFERFASWKRGTYEADAAQLSWALVDWIVRTHPGTLPLILDDLYRFYDEHSRRETSPTSWERVRGYEIPVDEQRAIFERRLGADFLEAFARDVQAE